MEEELSVILLPLKENKGNNLNYYLEYMRQIRNNYKDYMTRFRDEITPEMQKNWYENLPENINPYIFIACEHGVVIYPFGYGMIQYEDGKSLLTGAIEDRYRGKGYGRKLFLKLIDLSEEMDNKIFLEVLDTNTVALNLYKSLGFKFCDQKNNVITMELKK